MTANVQAWSQLHFGGADLGGPEAFKRLVKVATRMAERTGQSLPKPCPDWGELKAAYRLLSHPEIEPIALNQPHRELTLSTTGEHPIALAVQDDTHLAGRCGWECHSTLAVLPAGQLLGLLDQRFFERVEQPEGETRRERDLRWRESLVWAEAVEAVEAIGPGMPDCRMIHVADRAADNFELIEACRAVEVGFVIRVCHDRRVAEGTDKLWNFLASQPSVATCVVRLGEQRQGRKIVRRGREASVTVRFAAVQIEPPYNHPGQHAPQRVYAVSLREEAAADAEPVDWLLLTSEKVTHADEALRIVSYYQRRWVIEEWHRALKEGCALEAAQLDDPKDHLRLAALFSVIAVRMLQLRDLADPAHPTADRPEALQNWAPALWREVVAYQAGLSPEELTPRAFLLAIARQGGYLGRKNEPRPGWKVLGRGWYDFQLLVQGAELHASLPRFQKMGKDEDGNPRA